MTSSLLLETDIVTAGWHVSKVPTCDTGGNFSRAAATLTERKLAVILQGGLGRFDQNRLC